MPSLFYSGFTKGANSLTSATYSVVFLIAIGPKKTCGSGFISRKIGGDFLAINWAIFTRIPTSILTRDA